MSNKYQKIPAFTADFSYIMENDEEGIDEQFDGKSTVKADKYILEMSGQEILNDGVSVYTYSKDEQKLGASFVSKLQKQVKGQISLRSSDDTSGGFTISFDGGKSCFDFTDESLAQYLGTFLNSQISSIVNNSVK